MSLANLPSRPIAPFLLGLLLAGSALAVPCTAQTLCSARNGSGANPNGFACVSDPLIGTSWDTTVDIITPGVPVSAVAVFEGGPIAGLSLSIGELLCAYPILSTDFAAGFHSIPIPNDTAYLGLTLSTQAATVGYSPLRIQLQNAIDITIGALGNEDITVLVLRDDGDESTPPLPVSGATVTLQGTDPASMPGLTLTTGPGGTATFTGVAGPYSVTAQSDIDFQGTTTRLATSLIDIVPTVTGNPPAGTIGVLLLSEFEDEPDLEATLSGTVTNLPALSGNEFVKVVAVGNGQVAFEGGAIVDSVTGSYSLPIPANTPLDCFVIHGEDFTRPTSTIFASLLQPGVGQTGVGTTLTRDFDFGSSAVVPWNVPVTFSATNIYPGFVLSIQLLVTDVAGGIDFDFSFYDDFTSPTSILLPDVTNPEFSGYRVELDADTFDPSEILQLGQDCFEVLPTTPAAIAFVLSSPSTILQPPDLSTLTLAEFNNLTVEVVEGSTGTLGNNGFNTFIVATEAGSSGPPPPGIDQAAWVVFTPGGTTRFDLPPYSLPMFGSTQTLFCGHGKNRFAGYTFDYDSFFDDDLAANLAALLTTPTAGCDSETWIRVFLAP